MKEINIEVVKREKIGKSNSKNLRNDGKIPAIIYGDKKESNYIFLEYLDITEDHFYQVVDSWRLPHLWKKDNGEWELKHPII